MGDRSSRGRLGERQEERSHDPHLPDRFPRADLASRFRIEAGENVRERRGEARREKEG